MCQAIQSHADLQQHAEVISYICCSDVFQKISNSLKAAASSIMPASKPKDETARPLRVVKEETPDAQLRAAVQGTSAGMPAVQLSFRMCSVTTCGIYHF